MKLRGVIDQFLDRWIFGSQWAGRWSVGLVENVAGYSNLLSATFKNALEQESGDEVIRILKDTTQSILNGITADAINGVDTIAASSRSRVAVYRNYLWVWHRLETDRWAMTQIALKTKRRNTTSADVDHCVAFKLWERKVNSEWKGQDQTEKEELFSLVNRLGNCALLEKTFNISKSDKQLADFLPEIHEFRGGRNPEDWAKSLSLTDVFLSPTASDMGTIKTAIETRDSLVRDQLKQFIKGEKSRVDVA